MPRQWVSVLFKARRGRKETRLTLKKTTVVATALLSSVVGCKTVTVKSLEGSKVVCGDVTGKTSAEVQVAVWDSWFGGKEAVVSKTGYASKKVPLKFNSPSPIDVSLDRKFNITANQEGATVKVNGGVKGKTPASGIAVNDNSESVISVSKKGWLEAKIVVTPDTPSDINLVMDQDGSGRRLLDLVPEQDGVRVRVQPIFSDTDVGENSPNVAQVRRLTNQPQTEFIQSISLLPDGKSLVASILEAYGKEENPNYRANIWTLDSSIAGAPRRAVTSGDVFDITANASVDGETLYFSTTRNGKLGIWSLNMKTMGGLKMLTAANTADYSPAIGPDGKELLYSAVLPGGNHAAYLWTKSADGSGMPSQLREGYNAVWSPNGKKVLFVKGSTEKWQARIWVMDANGGNPTQISLGSDKFNDIDPRWSPDGKKIVFASDRGKVKGRSNYDIWLMDADGGNVTQLTTNSSCDDKPVFAPDGKTIFFRSNRGLVWDIWVMELSK